MNFTASIVHVLHSLVAGVWLGGLIFTLAVVSPAFKHMEWTPAQRIAVRSAVGRQYSKVARVNLIALLALAAAAWMLGGGTLSLVEIALVVLVFALSELHAGYYAPRLAKAAREGAEEVRRRLLRVSISVSMINLLLSIAVVVLAAWRSP